MSSILVPCKRQATKKGPPAGADGPCFSRSQNQPGRLAATGLLLGFFHRALGGVDGFTSGFGSFTGLVSSGTSGIGSFASGTSSSRTSGINRTGGRVSGTGSSVHRTVSSSFGTFGSRFCTSSSVVSSLFSASGEAERCGKDQRDCDRLFHMGAPLSKLAATRRSRHKAGTHRMSSLLRWTRPRNGIIHRLREIATSRKVSPTNPRRSPPNSCIDDI